MAKQPSKQPKTGKTGKDRKIPNPDGRPVSPVNGQPVPPPRWKKGQSGNPKGRPKGTTISAKLRKIVEQDDDGKIADALARAATSAALRGDFRFWKEIVDRLDGPVKQRVETEATGLIKIVRAEDAALLDATDDENGGPDDDDEEDEGGR